MKPKNDMKTSAPKPRWYRLTPDRLILALLVVEGLLWLSERLGWPAWHKGYAVLTAVASVGAAFLAMLLWLAASLIFRWRFQFSIRSLLVLVVVVAIPCSWMSAEMESARQQREAAETLKKSGWIAQYDYQVQKPGNPPLGAVPPGPAWLQDSLGEDFFASAVKVTAFFSPPADIGPENVKGLRQLRELWLTGRKVTDVRLKHLAGLTQLQTLSLGGTQVTDAGLKYLKALTQLRTLHLWGTQVTDAGLTHLEGLTQLQELDLSGTQVGDAGLGRLKGLTQLQTLNLLDTEVGDAGLARLKGLVQLQTLNLGGTQVTDAGMEHLKGLTQLQNLGLSGTRVTDAGLENLKGLAKLQELSLHSTRVTEEGVKKLQQALPKCEIFRNF